MDGNFDDVSELFSEHEAEIFCKVEKLSLGLDVGHQNAPDVCVADALKLHRFFVRQLTFDPMVPLAKRVILFFHPFFIKNIACDVKSQRE